MSRLTRGDDVCLKHRFPMTYRLGMWTCLACEIEELDRYDLNALYAYQGDPEGAPPHLRHLLR